jgi:hypothetical protein
MHGQGIVGYFAGKNGVGIRVFLNRASSSIGHRPELGQKNLRVVRASTEATHTSTADTPFKDSFADLEVVENNIPARAPENGAEQAKEVKARRPLPPISSFYLEPAGEERPSHRGPSIERILARLGQDLKRSLDVSTSQAIAREHERTLEWFESKGLPKAARVAQREAYDVLRRHGVIQGGAETVSKHARMGHNSYQPEAPHILSPEEIEELSQACVALLETRGQSIEFTLSEMSAAGGFLLAEDAPRVREKVDELMGSTFAVEHQCTSRDG